METTIIDGIEVTHSQGQTEESFYYWKGSDRIYHRIAGPAIIKPGVEYWFKHGKLHREDGPAMIDSRTFDEKTYTVGDFEKLEAEMWYKNGELHRIDGPAIIYKNGDEEWFYEGKLHRVGDPAPVL